MRYTLTINFKDKPQTSRTGDFSIENLGVRIKEIIKELNAEAFSDFLLVIEPSPEMKNCSTLLIQAAHEKKNLKRSFSDLKSLEEYSNGLKIQNVNGYESNDESDSEDEGIAAHNKTEEENRIKEIEQFKKVLALASGEERKILLDKFRATAYAANPSEKILKVPSILDLFHYILTAREILPKIPPDAILLCPGRSPFLHNIILNKSGINVYSFAFSGAPYIKDVLTQKQIQGFRRYLSGLNLLPEILDKVESIYILDYIATGNAIHSLLLFFAHWKYDLQHNTSITIDEWLALYPQNNCYLSYKNKTKLYSICVGNRAQELNPAIASLPLQTLSLSLNLSNTLINNNYYCLLPRFSSEVWDLPEDILENIFKYPPKQALMIKDLLLHILPFVVSLEKIANLIYKNKIDFGVFAEGFLHSSDEIELDQFRVEYIPCFIAKMLVLYPKLQEANDVGKIGMGKKYATVRDFLHEFDHNYEVTETVQHMFNLDLIRKTLGDHPESTQIIKLIEKLYADLHLKLEKQEELGVCQLKSWAPDFERKKSQEKLKLSVAERKKINENKSCN